MIIGKGLKLGSKPASKAITKKVSKEVSKKVAKKVVTKSLTKVATKSAAKGVGKSLLKKIPFVGLGMGIIFAADRLRKGDWGGALREVASGAASTIPGVGTGVSLALDAALIAKDVHQARSITGGDKIDAERKTGGPITKGQNVLVGEGGPEIIKASFTGTVENAHKTAQMISKDMGASEINMVPIDLGKIKTPPPQLPKIESPSPNETLTTVVIQFSSGLLAKSISFDMLHSISHFAFGLASKNILDNFACSSLPFTIIPFGA